MGFRSVLLLSAVAVLCRASLADTPAKQEFDDPKVDAGKDQFDRVPDKRGDAIEREARPRAGAAAVDDDKRDRVLKPAPVHRQALPRQGGAAQAPSAAGPHLADFAECREDIEQYCPQLKQGATDMGLLECLLDAGEIEGTTLSGRCEHLVWQFKLNMTRDERFHRAAQQFCKDELLPTTQHSLMDTCAREPTGYLLSCLLDHKDALPAESHCRRFLTRTERLVFSDFRLVGPFVDKCGAMVERYQCGSLQKPPIGSPQSDQRAHSQGSTLECLIEKMIEQQKASQGRDQFDRGCRHEIMRIAELQADDYHLDRPLYFACRGYRELFCANVQAGEGRVFECLMQHKNNPKMGAECVDILNVRAELLGQDYKISHPLAKACEMDIRKSSCVPQGDAQTIPEHFTLSYVILCLENAASTAPLQPMCKQEVFKHRQMMMSDYRLSPEMVLSCSQDIDKFCDGTLVGRGETLHCLMKHAQARNPEQALQAHCMQALSSLVKAANVGGDYRVDRVLYESCQELIDGPCSRESTSEHQTLSCLMNHLEDDRMDDECEERLLEVQYFMARDWTLDPRLYRACQKDATSKCSAQPQWHQAQGDAKDPAMQTAPERGPLVLACLFRSAYSDDEAEQLSQPCAVEVRRVLRERAARVQLMPNVEENCRKALAQFCSEKTAPGDELDCLQQHMQDAEFQSEHEECAKELAIFTEEESKDTKLNRALERSCTPVIDRYCKQFENEDVDHGDVMQCLIEHKGTKEMQPKCQAYVIHFELVSMKNYQFSYSFKKACAVDISTHCQDAGNDKTAIVRCLSTITFEHRVLGEGPQLDKECRRQLRVNYLQEEKVEAEQHPLLWKSCKMDLEKHRCYQAGDTTVEKALECLRKHKSQLQAACHKLVFAREEVEMADNQLDLRLQRDCSTEIESLCRQQPAERVLHCLKSHRRSPDMSARCWSVVEDRMKEQAHDIRLQPGLLTACIEDVKSYCTDEVKYIKDKTFRGEEAEGVVVACLRRVMTDRSNGRPAHVHPKCQKEVFRVIMESEVDPELDPPFYKACKEPIERHCGDALVAQQGHGGLMECMKSKYYEGVLNDKPCRKEMARRTSEELSDIHLDPFLFESCSLDLKHYCNDVPPGDGRLISCLLSAAESTNVRLSNGCRARLEDRRKLWNIAQKDDATVLLPENVAEFAQLLVESPARNSLLTFIFFVFFVLFAFGLCFGRLTKRVRREMKIK